MKPILSIIIISYNTLQITKNCLESVYASLENSPYPFEVIVVDNVSTDGSVEMLKEYEKQRENFTLIQNKENVGFARANNQATKQAKGEYLLFLNSDTVVINRAIEQLLEYTIQNKDTAHFVGGKLLNEDQSPQASCGPFYTLPVIFAALFLRGDYWGLTRSSPDQTTEADWVSGACILTKKEYFNDLGGFDEKIFMYMDEIDLLYRAKQKNYRVFFYPKARFVHRGSASSGNRTYPILQVFRGFLYFYKKHHSPLAMLFLRGMLQLKSLVAIGIGRTTNNQYLVQTYEEARKCIAVA